MFEKATKPPPAKEDLTDVLDNPLSAYYATKHPEVIENAKTITYEEYLGKWLTLYILYITNKDI